MKLKKPKFWDYEKPNLYATILNPLALFLQLLNSFKRKTYKQDLKIKTICFGNIYLGGTGKTSLCIALKNILDQRKIKSCFIKKYYEDQYDEQNILKKYGKLFTAKRRIDAIKKAENENYDFAILDDGLQDKSIVPDINIVCFNNINWIGNGLTIPAGPLRENINNLKNYDHVILNGNSENLESIKKKILSINSKINIHVGKYEVQNISNFKKSENYLVFSGIGNHKSFISMLKNEGLNVIKDLEFPDHYQYSKDEINKIVLNAEILNCKIITTEKDYLRLENIKSDKIQFVKSQIKIFDESKFLSAVI
tara:strand:- start:1412 stop:2338 length:927 start_codon:yes stop_codon:yes gene_type:complete